MKPPQPTTVQIYCRLTVAVHDPEAVTDLAIHQLRDADIDWSAEEADLETASVKLKADLLNSLASLATPDRMLDGIPGVAARGGRIWVEQGEPHPRFQPGFPGPADDRRRPAVAPSFASSDYPGDSLPLDCRLPGS